MNIKRLAISGGGYMGIALYGALKQLQIDNVYDPKNITHIYGTSAGAILSVLVALKYDWNDVDTYILERPWNKLFDVDFETIISSFGSCGIVDSHIIDDILLPFLGGRNLSSTITFDEFKSQTGVSLTIVATNSELLPVYFSPKSNPSTPVLDVVRASCSIPVVFQPSYVNNEIYIDGAFSDNFPVSKCESETEDCDYLAVGLDDRFTYPFDTTNLLTFAFSLFSKILMIIFCRPLLNINENNTLLVRHGGMSITDAINIVENKDKRQDLIRLGMNAATKWIAGKNNTKNM